jgi:hypothetical protein
MKLIGYFPEFIKRPLRPIYWAIRTSRLSLAIFHRPKKIDLIHKYWEAPDDGANLPLNYRDADSARGNLITEKINKYANTDCNILEIGCNVGRNLKALHSAGYTKLNGIEISKNAVNLMKESYPEMVKNLIIHNKPVESIIKEFSQGEFDVVYTMAVLEHIHTESEWIFSDMVKITKDILITIEDEHSFGERHFPRRYKKVFESIGMKQIEIFECEKVIGLNKNFYGRIFKKVT